jgi:hypothetical protein
MVKPENWTIKQYREELDRIRDGVEQIDPAIHATGSRDFGRGFSLAMKLVMEVITDAEHRNEHS